MAEHQTDELQDEDLVKITASGVVHLQLMANPDYLAACAEDTWLADHSLAERIAARLRPSHGRPPARSGTALSASDLVAYLRGKAEERVARPEAYVDERAVVGLRTLREAEAGVAAAEIAVSTRLFVGNLPYDCSREELFAAFRSVSVDLVDVFLPAGVGGAKKGHAFVEVPSGRAALAALDAQGVLRVRGRALRLDEAEQLDRPVTRRAPRKREMREGTVAPERLYFGNLPVGTTEREIRDLLVAHGFSPVDVFVSGKGESFTFGFASMGRRDEAAQAIGALNGTILHGLRIEVRVADARRP